MNKRTMSKGSRLAVRIIGVTFAFLLGLSLPFVLLAMYVGTDNLRSLAAAAYLITTEFPEVPFKETYRALVVTEFNVWVEFRHRSTDQSPGEVLVSIEEAMKRAGFDKRDAQQSRTGDDLWLLFVPRPENGFCYSVLVKQPQRAETVSTEIESTYRIYSERAYQVEKELGEHFFGEKGQRDSSDIAR